jgi:hypothetical protein
MSSSRPIKPNWLELARDPGGRERIAEFDKRLRQSLAKELRLGQVEGWVRKSLDCDGAANPTIALLSGRMFDAEVGLAVDIKSTARATADLFSGVIQL